MLHGKKKNGNVQNGDRLLQTAQDDGEKSYETE